MPDRFAQRDRAFDATLKGYFKSGEHQDDGKVTIARKFFNDGWARRGVAEQIRANRMREKIAEAVNKVYED